METKVKKLSHHKEKKEIAGHNHRHEALKIVKRAEVTLELETGLIRVVDKSHETKHSLSRDYK